MAITLVILRVQTRRLGVRVADVVETMRPLQIESLADTPGFVLGLAIIRGAPTPVIDAAALVGAAAGPPAPAARFAVLRAGARRVALAVDEVIGVRDVPATSLDALPPLADLSGRAPVAAIGTLDGALLEVLDAMRIVPDELWERLRPDADGGAPA